MSNLEALPYDWTLRMRGAGGAVTNGDEADARDLRGEDDDDGPAIAARAKRPVTKVPPRSILPPAFAAVSDEELYAACDELMSACFKVRKHQAQDLFWQVWEKVLTTRPFNPTRGKLKGWLERVATSVCSNEYKKEKRARLREAVAHEGFQREEVGALNAPSAEGLALDHADASVRQDAARTFLERLRARLAKLPLALRVIDEQEKGNDKPMDIAAALGVPRDAVYAAKESVRYHAAALLREDEKKPSQDDGEKK